MSKLLIRPHRQPDECIVSYLIPVSEQNGFHHIGHLLQHAGLPWKNLRIPTHQMITGEYDIEPYFSQLGLDYTYPRTADTFKSSQLPHFTTKIFVKTPKICPECLEETGYSSDLWSHIAYTACVKHKLLLVDTSPKTGKRLSWYRRTLNEFNKNDPFPTVNLIPKASPATLAFTRTMAYLIEGRSLPISTPAVLKGLNFVEALSLIHFIAHYQYRLFHHALFSPASLDNLNVSLHYTQAWQSLKRWPQGFHLLISQYIDNPMSDRGQSGINKHFRDIHEKLHRQRKNKGIARLRAAFDQFIEINWPNAIQTHRLTRISLSSSERPLITQKEAQRILACREPRIHSLIAQDKITLHKFKGKVYFNRDQIESLAKMYQDNWSMEQAVLETELSRYQLKQLLDAGFVKALQKADSQNRDWLICKKSWQHLINNLKKSADQNQKAQGKTLSGLQKQGFMITNVFYMLARSELSYFFKEEASKPLSFKQLGNFNWKQSVINSAQ
ncbi:TniQ family protein [uncultured Microbulbifer sp.]|uniref:TniQ family protein n=1 Tax=uncultured Microbulbifer sp. TaxID=348147 RepID=UPI002610204C|nr:TniQ family protein [uncultured Microbulbifer sp.]